MADLAFLEQYSGQTSDELLALEGRYRTDSIVLAFEQGILNIPTEKALTDEERVVLAVEALEREVNNGGYGQFFTNSSNEYVPIIVEALDVIGARTASEITKAAIDALRISGTLTVESIEKVMGSDDDTRNDILSRCDGRYYDEVGDLSTALLGYIKANRAKILMK